MRHAVRMVLASRFGLPFALVLLAAGAAQAPAPPESAPATTRPAAPGPAGDTLRTIPPPPRALPPADEVLFADDFRTLDAWTADREGVWSVADGVLCGHLPDGRQQRSLLTAGAEDWRDYAVDVDICQLRGVDKGVAVCVRGSRGVAVDLRGGDYQDVLLYRQEIPLGSAKVAERRQRVAPPARRDARRALHGVGERRARARAPRPAPRGARRAHRAGRLHRRPRRVLRPLRQPVRHPARAGALTGRAPARCAPRGPTLHCRRRPRSATPGPAPTSPCPTSRPT